MNRLSVGLLALLVLILITTGCQTKIVTFADHMADFEKKVQKVVDDEQRASEIISISREMQAKFSEVRNDYQELLSRKSHLDFTYNHDSEAYRILYGELDELNDLILSQLFEYSSRMRSVLNENEYKKLADEDFYNTYVFHLDQGV